MSNKINCIVVDDSTVQRLLVTKLVQENQYLTLLADFSNALEAKHYISNHKVDVVFLDIEMPIFSGFDLLDGLSEKPFVIFITSRVEYALKAFDYSAIDYLQKPVTKERFNTAISKLKLVKNIVKEVEPEPEGPFIFIKSNLKNIKLYFSKITFIEAYGDYVKIFEDNDVHHLVLSTMKKLEEQLPENQFVRIHKSFIVNLEKVVSFDTKNVQIKAHKLPLSRNKKEELAQLLGKN